MKNFDSYEYRLGQATEIRRAIRNRPERIPFWVRINIKKRNPAVLMAQLELGGRSDIVMFERICELLELNDTDYKAMIAEVQKHEKRRDNQFLDNLREISQ